MQSINSILFPETKKEKIFNTERLAYSGKDGQCFTSSYKEGGLITDDKLQEGLSVITVKDNKGKTQILGQNFK